MSTKIYATVDALGNPTGFHLTPGQAHDLEGAEALLPGLQADMVLADKAYDADQRVIQRLREAGIEPVIPAKANRKQPRLTIKTSTRLAVSSRNSSVNSNSFELSRRAMTKRHEIS